MQTSQNFQLIDYKNNSLRLRTDFNLKDEKTMLESFGKQLSKWRESVGINQSELARRVKVSPNYISNLERDYSPTAKGGKPQPSVEVVDAIARALNVSTAEARLAAGYAPPKGTPQYDNRLEELFEGLKESVQRSGAGDIEDADVQERLFNNLRKIAETMIQDRLEEQQKSKSRKQKQDAANL